MSSCFRVSLHVTRDQSPHKGSNVHGSRGIAMTANVHFVETLIQLGFVLIGCALHMLWSLGYNCVLKDADAAHFSQSRMTYTTVVCTVDYGQ